MGLNPHEARWLEGALSTMASNSLVRRIAKLDCFRPKRLSLREHQVRQTRKILVLIKGESPSFSYYMESRLLQLRNLSYSVLNSDLENIHDIEPEGTFVIICRYIRLSQLFWLSRNRHRLSGVALFVDDDIAEIVAGTDGSLLYRGYLAFFGLLPILRLNRFLTHVWASTPPLQARLAKGAGGVDLLCPAPVLCDHLPFANSTVSAFVAMVFHATDVHIGEHEFLVPIVKTVMSQRPHVTFEVRARGKNSRLWRSAGLDPQRFRVTALTSWPQYRAETRSGHADIFLVPLLDTETNTVRADTKRVDCCRLGAAAVFSKCAVYGASEITGEVHVVNDAASWVSAILLLVDDHELRKKAVAATRLSVVAMAEEATHGFPF